MSDVVLKNGETVTVNVSDLTVKEWRGFVDPKGSPADEDAVISKCTGLNDDELQALSWEDYRRLALTIVRLAQAPLTDPN